MPSPLEEAKEAYDRGDFETALQEYQRAAAAFGAVVSPPEDTGV